MRRLHSLVVGTCTVLAASLAAAGPAVLFQDGRQMRVAAVERIEDQAVLELEGGGSLAVPAERIVNWEAIEREAATAADPTTEDSPEVGAWWTAAGDYADVIARTAERHAVDPALLAAMAEVESAFDPSAVSPKGACGLLQLMPQTAQRFGVDDVFDPWQNADGGARYLSWLLERFEGRTELALAGYNAGEGAVDRYRGIPPYPETRAYVKRVLRGHARLASYGP